MYKGIRLITLETKVLSRSEVTTRHQRPKKLGGIVIESAEGIRFAYATTKIPEEIVPKIYEVTADLEPQPMQLIQNEVEGEG